jgi:capsid protein
MDVAVMSGALSLPSFERRRAEYLACEWLPTKWDWVDPLKDTNAELAQIAAGLKSRTQAISERGYDAEEVDQQIAKERERERELGLAFSYSGTRARSGAASELVRDGDDDPDDEDADDEPRSRE